MGRGWLKHFQALNLFVESSAAEAASSLNPNFGTAGDSKALFSWRGRGGELISSQRQARWTSGQAMYCTEPQACSLWPVVAAALLAEA